MKLSFFLIALFLILVRIVYPHLELWHNQRESGTMITKSDNYIEGIWWSGKIRLSDDEQSVAEISPGGHLKYRQQDTLMLAESDLQGKITYTLRSGKEELPLNAAGKTFLANQLQKMIRLGFFAEDRAQRIYQQGGANALLAELSNIRMEGARAPYLKLLFETDTLSVPQRLKLLQLLDSSNNSGEQQHYLAMFPPQQLRDTAIARAWLKAVDRLNAAYMKKELLLPYITPGLPADRFDTVLAITQRFESESDQQDVYKHLLDLPPLHNRDSSYALPWLSAVGHLQPSYMKKELLLQYLDTTAKPKPPLPATQFDTILAITTRFESQEEQKDVFERLIDTHPTTSPQWIGLIHATGALHADYLKSDLLLKIAPKMPKTDSLITAYRASAKKIEGDMEYGKVMRAIE